MMESWPSKNGGGHGRNSSAVSISSTPRLAWQRSFTGLHPYGLYSGYPQFGVRSLNLCVRNGEVVLVIPSEDAQTRRFPNDKRGKVYAPALGVLDLQTGITKREVFSNHHNASPGIYSGQGGPMGNDTPIGTVTAALTELGDWYSAHGSDYAGAFVTSIDADVKGPYLRLAAPSNSSGVFVMASDNAANWHAGGNASHEPWLSNYAMHYWGSFLARGAMLYSYTCSNRYHGPIVGTKIVATELTGATTHYYKQRWVFDDPTRSFCGFDGAPRPFCLGDDETVYWFGYLTSTHERRLFGVKGGKLVTEIPTGDTSSIPSDYTVQAAMLGNYFVAFQPESQAIPAKLWCFDVAGKKLAWKPKEFAKGVFVTQTHASIYWHNREQAVRMVIAGGRAYVIEPKTIVGKLALSISGFDLADGAWSSSTLQTAIPVVPNDFIGSPALRDTAAVNGIVMALVDYDRTSQALLGVA